MTDRMNAYIMEKFSLQVDDPSHAEKGMSDQIYSEGQNIPTVDESGIKGEVFSSNLIPGMIFDPTLPLKFLQRSVLSKKGK
jgi:hypothetical protein